MSEGVRGVGRISEVWGQRTNLRDQRGFGGRPINISGGASAPSAPPGSYATGRSERGSQRAM